MTYRERLPPECPPGESTEIGEPLVVFRLVCSTPPADNDFLSERELNPEQPFRVSECLARGLSVFLDLDDCRKVKKLPKFRGRPECRPCRIQLGPGAGKILQTSIWSHHTWWPYAAYDVLKDCEVIDS